MENNVKNDQQKSSRLIRNSASCKHCDENHADKSKSISCDKIQAVKNNTVVSRQTTISDYFPRQEVEKPCNDEPKGAEVMVDFRKLVTQLLNAKVVVERLSQAAIKAKPCPTLRINIERVQLNPHQQQKADQPLNTGDCTIRYCHKCKLSHVDHKRTTVRRKCHKCGTDLLFVCEKCNGNFYQQSSHMERHRKLCDGRKKLNMESIKFYYCADCKFFTAYEASMTLHVAKTQHKIMLKHV